MNPGDRERAQLRRRDTDGVRRGAVGVVAHRDGGAPDPRSTQPTDHDEGHHEHGEAHVVVRPLRRQVEAEQRPARERNRREIVGQHRLAEQVLRRGDREGERADREEQAAHAQSAYADQRREAGGNERRDHDGEQERQWREIEVQHAQIEVHASRQRRRDQGAEPGEGHLPERQLARPAGEDDQREPADREARDRGVQQVPRGLRDQERQEDREQKERAQDDRVEPLDPPDVAQLLGDLAHLGRERERLGLGRTPAAALERHRDQHGDEQQTVDEAGLVEVVEVDQRLHDADGDPGEHRPRERHHARDDRRGECAHQRVRPEREQVACGPAVVRRDQHHREGGQRIRRSTTPQSTPAWG